MKYADINSGFIERQVGRGHRPQLGLEPPTPQQWADELPENLRKKIFKKEFFRLAFYQI